jgi:predicted helicase
VAEEFNTIYIIDLKGNARTSGERRPREGGNVFSGEIRIGVAVYFLLKDENAQGCKIYYHAIQDYAKTDEKKQHLRENQLKDLDFKRVVPDTIIGLIWLTMILNNCCHHHSPFLMSNS